MTPFHIHLFQRNEMNGKIHKATKQFNIYREKGVLARGLQ